MKMEISKDWIMKMGDIEGDSEVSAGYAPPPICPCCTGPVMGFKDEISKKEYEISGMCLQCQDRVLTRIDNA